MTAWKRCATAVALLASCAKDGIVTPPPPTDAASTGLDGSADAAEPTIDQQSNGSPEDANSNDAFDPFGPFDRATPSRPDAKADASASSVADDAGIANDVGSSSDADADGSPNVLPEAGGECATTQCVFAAQPAECLACDRDRGVCLDPAVESLTLCEMMAPLTPDRSEATICIRVLEAIISSGCAADGQLNPCLCGTVDGFQCQTGAVEPKGPLYELYADDFSPGTRKIADIVSNFTNPAYGAGAANAMIQCLAAFGCDTCLTPAIPARNGR